MPTKIHIIKAVVFPVVMYGCESWTTKKAGHWRIDAFELWCWRRLCRVPWIARRSNQPILKEINPEYSIERTDAEASILWPPDAKSWLVWMDPNAGKDWKQEEKGMTEDQMVGWHHQFNGHEFEQIARDGEGLGTLSCCSPWGCKESDMTEWLNNRVRGKFSTKGRSPWLALKNAEACVSPGRVWLFDFEYSRDICIFKVSAGNSVV